jgi:hypothetical protein
MPKPLFRLIFWGDFCLCLNALQDSQLNFEAVKRGYDHEYSRSQKLRIAEDLFHKSDQTAFEGVCDARLKFFSERKHEDEDFA